MSSVPGAELIPTIASHTQSQPRQRHIVTTTQMRSRKFPAGSVWRGGHVNGPLLSIGTSADSWTTPGDVDGFSDLP